MEDIYLVCVLALSSCTSQYSLAKRVKRSPVRKRMLSAERAIQPAEPVAQDGCPSRGRAGAPGVDSTLLNTLQAQYGPWP